MTSHVSKKYDLVAKLYDWVLLDYTRLTIRHALKIAELQDHAAILDIGCGTGPLEAKLLPRLPNIQVDACDLSQGMITQAEQKLAHDSRVRFHVGDFVHIPFPAAHYDTIFALSNLHYFPDPLAMLKRACELAKPGAQLILVDWEKKSIRSQLYEHWMQRVDKGFRRIYELEDIQQLLAQAGWSYDTHHNFGIRGLWKMMALRAKKS